MIKSAEKSFGLAAEGIRVKDQPSMTAATFAIWINSELLPNSHLPLDFLDVLLHVQLENGCMILIFT